MRTARRRSLKVGYLARPFLLLVLGATVSHARAAGPSDAIRLDRGVNSLFVLLHLEGCPVPLERLLEALPARRPEGYSMAELAAAARSCGLALEGVRFVRGDRFLDRVAIAFLEDQRGGHFVVLRPVGTTRTMVQVIDPPHASWIVDYDRIHSMGTWTGRILAPCGSTPRQAVVAVSLAVAGLIGLAVACRHRVRRRGGLDAGAARDLPNV